jgi:two-component system, NtrC family, nitrogen regulation response regulator GlnG
MNTVLFPENPILIVDDEESVIVSLVTVLKSHGMNNVISCGDSREAAGIVQSGPLELVLLDLTMPHVSGNELLSDIHDGYPDLPVIIVTGTNEVRAAVECMKAGAFDYMVKAIEENRLVSGVKRAIEINKLRRECGDLRDKLVTSKLNFPEAFSHILTQSKKMHAVFLLVESVARTHEPVLVVGETGVGKYLIAKAIHEASGREGPLVDVNAAGLDDTMFADSLFGHKKGAFTGAIEPRAGFLQQARGGTLFLDEIGDLSLSSQVKLLRLLDTREYYPIGSDLAMRTDARMIVATNRDLRNLIDSERFRKDLYYRLSTHEIRIPPLRERKEDLPLLTNFFLQKASKKLGKTAPSIPRELYPLLESYHFPGNVRELRSMMYDAAAKGSSRTLPLSSFKETVGIGARDTSDNRPADPVTFPDSLPTIKQATELLIAEAMKRAKGNQSLAAGLLGISHQALNKRLIRADGNQP